MKFLFSALIILLLAVTASAAVNVDLRWDPPSAAPAGYNVYRASAAGGPYTKMNGPIVTATSYVDANAPNAVVFYVVRSVNTLGIESVNGNELRLDLTAPAPPTNLRLNGITTVELFVNGSRVAQGPPPIQYTIPRMSPPRAIPVRVTAQ